MTHRSSTSFGIFRPSTPLSLVASTLIRQRNTMAWRLVVAFLLLPLVAPQECSSYVMNEIAKIPAPLVNDSYVLRATASGNVVAFIETNGDGSQLPRRGTAVLLHVDGTHVTVGGTYAVVGDIALGRNGTLAAMAFHNDPNENLVPDYVRVLERNANGDWEALGNDIETELDNFQSLYWNGETLVLKENFGSILQYSFVLGVWTQLPGRLPGDLDFAVDGSIASSGRSSGSDSYKGHGDIFRYNGTSWELEWTTVTFDVGHFWVHTDVSEDVVVFGFEKQRNEMEIKSGTARVVHFVDGNWTQTAELYPPEGGHINDRFGGSVSLSQDGEWLAVGADTLDTNSLDANGGIFLYRQGMNRTWDLVDLVVGDANSDWFGGATALNEDATLMIGAGYANYVKVFRRECGRNRDVAGSSSTSASSVAQISFLGLAFGLLFNAGITTY